MLQQNLHTHCDEDNAADQLRLGLVLCAEDIADFDADGGENKGDRADKGDGGDDVHLQKGKRNADGQPWKPW